MSVWSLGALTFDDLQGDFDLPQMRRESETKTGNSGVSVFNTGRRGQVFEMRSQFAHTSYANARALEVTYANTFTASPVAMLVGNVGFTGIQFVVLEVKTSIQSVPFYHCPRGNISPAYVVHATWKLQPVEV